MHRQSRPSFTLGIEEEYLLVDAQTMQLAEAPAEMMAALGEELGDNVSPEFLRCQVEIGTPRCADVAEARAQLRRLRGAVAAAAGAHGLAPIAASTHPMADWRDQKVTDKDRYATHARMMQAVAERILVSGMHVHVGLDDDDLRIDLMPQLAYFVPHLLALTTSSPFWRGADTGLASYRVSVFDGLPRTGLPGRFGSWSEYRRTVALLVESHEIEDASFIWWDVRPAERFPTLELRIMDVCPRLDDALAVTALIQALVRMLWRLKTSNMRWRTYDDFLVQENRWRAQRYGVREGLFDFGRGTLVPFTDLVEELIGLVAEDAEALGSSAEIARLRDIVKLGTGADRQRAAYAAALEIDPSEEAALTAVTRLLAEDFLRTG